MSKLPVREMVLYKHGVGFFRREAEFNGEEITLTFRHDEINDVLKSLAAFDQRGGQVLGIHYQTPMDKAARLADSAIRLSDAASLLDLLRDLRGRRVTLFLDEGEEISGRLLGIDKATGEEEGLADTLITLAADEDVIQVIALHQLGGLRIHDDRAEHDLHFFLDTSMSEDIRRTVTVRLSPGDHRLVAYYVAPTPTWRVSYRVIATADEDRTTGEALLQGWGLFDNRLDEDLENVSVTLVAGQPISFIYDLYASRIPQRPVIEDQARIAPGPVEFRGEAPKLKKAERRMLREDAMLMAAASPPAPAPMAAGAVGGMAYAEEEAPAWLSADVMQESMSTSAEGREAGEFFQYVVTTPVSVKRGDSALVPILGSTVSYNRELLYNGAKFPEHPVAALRFDNTTGLTLERGPVTLVEDGEYKGEAIIDFTKTGRDVYLPYAVELGVRVIEDYKHDRQMSGLSFREGYLLIEEYSIETITYRIENTTADDKRVTIEAAITPNWELFDTPEPDTVNATEHRWRIDSPAGSIAEFVKRTRHLEHRHEEIRRLDYRRLQHFFQGRWLDQAAYNRLSEVLDNIGTIQAARAEKQTLEGERRTIYERQGQLRENMNALKAGGEEGQLRTRMLRQLEASENRVEGIDHRQSELDQVIQQAEVRINELIAMLGEPERQ